MIISASKEFLWFDFACKVLMDSPLTFFEVVSFSLLLITDISSINSKPLAANNIVHVF